MIFEIYVDGSSYINGDKKCSSSAFMIYCNETCITEGTEYFSKGTNNKGEAMAVLLGLKELESRLSRIDKSRLKPPYNVRIIGDSLLTIEGCRSWIYAWLKNSKDGVLINSKKEAVINGEIFKDIYNKYTSNEKFKIDYIHVNSHALDTGYDKYEKLIRKYFIDLFNKKDPDALPDAVFNVKAFKKVFASYSKINKKPTSREELLRMLMHNKECDELAYDTLNKNLKG